MDRQFDIAVIGTTRLISESILETMAERQLPVGTLHWLYVGDIEEPEAVRFNDKTIQPHVAVDFDFSHVHIAFLVTACADHQSLAQRAADAGCVVIDVVGAFRMEPDIPLVIAGINDDRLPDYTMRHIVSMPSAISVMVWRAAIAIQHAVGIEAMTITALQSVSGTGKAGIEELAKQTAQLLNARAVTPSTYRKQIAFNVLPQAGDLLENGYTTDEMNLIWDAHRLLDDTSIAVTPSCIRVPVFHGDSAQVTLDTQAYISADEAQDIWSQTAGIVLMPANAEMDYATPVTEAVGSDQVFISRVREDISGYQKLSFWVTADNVKTSTAQCAVQLSEQLIDHFL